MAEVIGERQFGAVIVLDVHTRLKGLGENTLRDRIEELTRAGRRQILINLAHVPHLDSGELGRLIRCHLALRQAGGRARICNVTDRVRKLLEISRLDTVFEVFATEEEALASISASKDSVEHDGDARGDEKPIEGDSLS